MKTLQFLTFGLLFTAAVASSQVSVSVNINAPAPPWIAAPVAEARFYYLPDIQVYYDRPAAQFIYYGGSGWVRARRLPAAYRHYDLYRTRTVCLTDYHGYAPYRNYSVHRARYARPAYHVKPKHYGHYRGKGHHKPKKVKYSRY